MSVRYRTLQSTSIEPPCNESVTSATRHDRKRLSVSGHDQTKARPRLVDYRTPQGPTPQRFRSCPRGRCSPIYLDRMGGWPGYTTGCELRRDRGGPSLVARQHRGHPQQLKPYATPGRRGCGRARLSGLSRHAAPPLHAGSDRTTRRSLARGTRKTQRRRLIRSHRGHTLRCLELIFTAGVRYADDAIHDHRVRARRRGPHHGRGRTHGMAAAPFDHPG